VNLTLGSFFKVCPGREANPGSGLPDGSFSNQKSQFGKKIFQGLRLENIDIFYGHLEYLMDIWDIL
jgi:hypothetical protein